MKYEELVQKVQKWGDEKGFIEYENRFQQLAKLDEETGELLEAVGQKIPEMVEDAAGDIQVVLILLCDMVDIDYIEMFDNCFCKYKIHKEFRCYNIEECILEIAVSKGRLSEKILKNDINSLAYYMESFLFHILLIANFFGVNEFSLKTAWDEIKNREGKVIDGSFVKQEDL